jgi:DNA-binding Lrp family transcriptional regulator
MPVKAFILIEVAAGRVLRVVKEISRLDGVQSCHAIAGQYDVIVLLEAGDLADIGRMCLSRIQTIDGVLRTVTCHVIDL